MYPESPDFEYSFGDISPRIKQKPYLPNYLVFPFGLGERTAFDIEDRGPVVRAGILAALTTGVANTWPK